MKFCRQCGAEMKEDAIFCPKCGVRVKGADNTGIWDQLEKQNQNLSGQHDRKTNDAIESIKDLSGRASEGMEKIIEKTSAYGEMISEKAKELTQNTAHPSQKKEGQGKPNKRKQKKQGSKKILLPVFLVVLLVLIAGGIYYKSRFTLVGVWQIAGTENVNLGDIDLTDPNDIIKKALLTAGSGTRIVFTKEGDIFATASLGGVTIGPGTMNYSKNNDNSFTITASVNAVVTTLSANYSCGYHFEGPDQLLVSLGDATLTLTRDKNGDPEEYLSRIQESPIGFQLNLVGSEGDDNEDGGIHIPESSEELKEGMQNIGNKLSGLFNTEK